MRKHKKQFIVFGMGRFGSSVAKALMELGHEVLAVDGDQDTVDEIAPFVTQAVQIDATDEEAISSLDPGSFDAAVVAIGSDVQNSVLISLLCKEAGIPQVIAKANNDLHAKLLQKIGVDRVIFPERDMGQRLAKSLVSPGILDMMNLDGGYRVAEVVVPEEWSGRTLVELNIRRKYGVSVIAIRSERGFVASPGAEAVLMAGDTMVVLGHEDQINDLEQQ